MNRYWKIVLITLIALAASYGAWGAGSGDLRSENFTLDIFGNANMDDTINADDKMYVQGIINGSNKATELADANYDGKIDPKDIAQIELIICGEEKNLTIMQTIRPYTATSATREPVTVPMPIKRIVALSREGTEMLCVLGEVDKIVAIPDADMAEARNLTINKPTVGNANEWDIESIVKLKPDIVLAYSVFDYSSQRKILKDAGIALIQMDFYVPETFTSEVRMLGWLLNKKDRTKELIDFEQEHLNIINDRVKNLKNEQKPRVYAECYGDFYYAGFSTSVGSAVGPCGGIDIFKGINAAKIDSEEVVSKNPQVILHQTDSTFISQSGYNATDNTQMAAKVKSIMNRTGWENIDAVKNSRVYVISSTAASIHMSIFNLYVAKLLHPELFKDMDPVAIHREWLQKFLGVDLKGIYVYPIDQLTV